MQPPLNQTRKKQGKQRFLTVQAGSPVPSPASPTLCRRAGCSEPREDSQPTAPLTQVSPSLLPLPSPDHAAGHCIRPPDQGQMPKPRVWVGTLNFHCWSIQRNHVKGADFRKKAAERMGGRHAGLGGGFCTGHERSSCYKKILQQYWGDKWSLSILHVLEYSLCI